jgi:hypothetical protein
VHGVHPPSIAEADRHDLDAMGALSQAMASASTAAP